MKWRVLMFALTAMAVCVIGIDAGGGKKDTKKPEAAATGTIEIYKNKKGDYRYRIKNAEGKTIAMPLPQMNWEKKEECLKAIDDLKMILVKTKPVEVKE